MRSQWETKQIRTFMVAAAVFVALLAAVVAPWASDAPDGFNKVVTDRGLQAGEQEHPLSEGPLAGYSVRGIDDDRLATAISGIIGVSLTFAVAIVAFKLVRRTRTEREDTD